MKDFVENYLDDAKKFTIFELIEHGFLQNAQGTHTYYLPHDCVILLLCDENYFRVKHIVEKYDKFYVKFSLTLEVEDDTIGLSQAILLYDRFAVIKYVNEQIFV